MAWVASADFNGLTNGNLAGQGGGSGWSNNWGDSGGDASGYTVQGTTVYEGAKAVTSSGTGAAGRALTTPISSGTGIVYLAMRRTQTTGTEVTNISFRNASSGQARMQVRMDNSANIVLTGVINVTVLAGYSANTWYAIRVTYDMTLGTYTGAYSTSAFGSGGSWSAESSATTMLNTGDIDWVVMNQGDPDTAFFDYISPTDPLPAPANNNKFLNLLGVGV